MANITVSETVKGLMHSRKVRLHEPAQITRSQWTGRSKVLLLPGAAYWTFVLSFRPVYTEAEARALRSFMAQLYGQSNTFDMPILPNDQFNVNKTTLASVTNAGSAILPLDNATTMGIAEGMYGSVPTSSGHKRLFIIAGPITTNNVAIDPPVHENVLNAAVAEFRTPVSRVRRADPDWQWDEAMAFTGFALDLEEAI